MFDTGSTINFINREIGKKFSVINLPTPIKIGLGGKKQTLNSLVILDIKISRFNFPSQIFYLADIKGFDVIFGAFFLEQFGIVLDPKKKSLKISEERIKLQEEIYYDRKNP